MIYQQTLIIHNFKVLFNILNEIKYLLNFNLKSLNAKEIEGILNDSNNLIISGEKNFNLENQLILNYPINVLKLIEIININFLKKKFNEQNNIRIGKYSINLNSRIMNKDKVRLSLTEKEAQIITFLNKFKIPTSIIDLQKEVWGHKSKLETHTVETHIYRLRKKIKEALILNNFIINKGGRFYLNHELTGEKN